MADPLNSKERSSALALLAFRTWHLRKSTERKAKGVSTFSNGALSALNLENR